MSRKTLSPSRRGVAGLTAAAVATGTLGVLLVGTSTAADTAPTLTSATVAAPVPTKTVTTIPAAGAFNGTGGAVSIVGTDLPATPTVKFGTVAASAVLRLSDTLLVAKAPAKTGTNSADVKVNIVVDDHLDSGGTSPVTLTDGYTYKAAPVLTDAAYSADGKSVVISGTNVADVSQLTLGGTAVKVKPTEVVSGKITVKVPSGLTKAGYSITAISPWGSGTLTSDWAVRPVPSKIVAATGTATVGSADSKGGTVVRVLGTALGGVDAVTFGGATATVVVSSDKELYVKVPAMASSEAVVNNVAKVLVTVKNGSLAAKTLKFEYKVAPIVDLVENVTAATKSVVTINGSNLLGAKLYFGSGKGAKSLSPKSGASATKAEFVMPSAAGTGFALGTAYPLWIVTKGGNLDTGRTITVTG